MEDEQRKAPERINIKIKGVKVFVIYYSLWDGEEINVKEHSYKGEDSDLLLALQEYFNEAETINL